MAGFAVSLKHYQVNIHKFWDKKKAGRKQYMFYGDLDYKKNTILAFLALFDLLFRHEATITTVFNNSWQKFCLSQELTYIKTT